MSAPSNIPRPGSLRPSQIITTFGPGSIYDVLSDSILIMAIDFWSDSNYREIEDERLIAHLKRFKKFRNMQKFRVPSSSGNKDNVSVVTFPTWGECPRCHKLTRRDGNPARRRLNCPDCKTPMTHPARLIVACPNGHIDDFPWYKWVKHTKECGDDKLYLRQGAKTVSLAGLEVYCENCGARKDLGTALSSTGVKFVLGRCQGRRLWLKDTEPHCDQDPRGLLKGASNVYFSSTVRALYIPPFTDEINTVLKQHWATILLYRDDPEMIRNIVKKALPQFDVDEVIKRIEKRFDATEGRLQVDIERDEWNILRGSKPYDHADFKTEIIEVPYKFSPILSNLVLVRRLKETVVLKGFSRINPADSDDPNSSIADISLDDPIWLPAVENYGEGVFFSFNESTLSEWENLQTVSERNAIINDQHRYIRQQHNKDALGEIPPRFTMLHTLSHLLIREMATYAGYSSASIRERVYGDKGMAGIMLYTSSASSDGSLGGLVNLGNTAFEILLSKAVGKAQWCSSDPLCSLHKPEISHRDNGAACHACSFLPETSCVNMNSLLDRAMVTSTAASRTTPGAKNSLTGFFEYVKSR
jgi:hypothetical protein